MAEDAPTRLKALLQERLWHSYATFCAEYDQIAKSLDKRLVGTYPSRAQFHRWLSGTVKNLPHPHHRRVLACMFPDWNIEQLFQVNGDAAPDPNTQASRALPKGEIGDVLYLVDAGLKAPDGPPPPWGRPEASRSERLTTSLTRPISSYGAQGLDKVTRQLGTRLVELSRLLRLTDIETHQLAALAGNVVELELNLNIEIEKDGRAHVLYQHDLINLSDKPLSRMPREIWFQYLDAPITITPIKYNERQIVIQRIHDAGSLAKFAFKISPPLQLGERTTVRYLCDGGSFRDALYWRQVMPRYTRHYTFTMRQRGIGKLSDCFASIEYPDGSEASVTEGLLWDHNGDDVSITLVADYLRPGQAAEVRWEASRVTT